MPIPPKYSAETKAQAFKLYCKGVALDEISRQTGINFKTLKTMSHREQWKAKKIVKDVKLGLSVSGAHENIVAVGREDNDTHKLEALPFEEKQAHFRQEIAAQALRLPAIMASMTNAELVKNADKLHKLEQIARRGLNLEEPAPAPVINIGLLSANPTLPPLQSGGNLVANCSSTDNDMRIKEPHVPLFEEEKDETESEATEAES